MKGREEVAVSCLVLVSPQQPTPDCEGMPDTTQAVSLTLAGYLFLVVPLSQRRRTKTKTTTLLFVNVVGVAFSFRCSPLTQHHATYFTYLVIHRFKSASELRARDFFLCPTSPSSGKGQTQQEVLKYSLSVQVTVRFVRMVSPQEAKKKKNGAQVVCKRKEKKKKKQCQRVLSK